MTVTPVILSGGSGSRLWPLSREKRPKQFLDLKDGKSLFQLTVERCHNADLFAAPIVVANEDHRFMAVDGCHRAGVNPKSVFLEPFGRNTAPAMAIVALAADPDEVLLFLPSDQLINDVVAFYTAIQDAIPAAKDGEIVTFGMAPTEPATGYGYIEAKTALSGPVLRADRFVEKPDVETAIGYLEQGGFYWNGGIFLATAGSLLDAFAQHAPDILQACEIAKADITEDLDFSRLSSESFGAVRAESIDYAIMEKAENVALIPVDMGWSDLGSFSALAELYDTDQAGNRSLGDTVTIDCENSFFYSPDRLIAAVGLKDVVVVDTDDALLVADKSRDQDVKAIVQKLKQAERPETEFHNTVYRPWGTFKSVAQGKGFQVKEIVVYPGKRLSLQKHFHRSEHWIVVSGIAVVEVDNQTQTLEANQSVYIPVTSVHRLENSGKVPLVLIEVQSGDYLGEDDIVRLEDDFKRSSNE